MRISRIAAMVAAAVIGLITGASESLHAMTPPFDVGTKQGLFLHLSDIHFDPFADPTLLARLVDAQVKDWETIFRTSKVSEVSGYGKDSNFPLLMSTLSAAKDVHYDFVLATGDNLSHDFRKSFDRAGGNRDKFADFVMKTMQFIDHVLKQSFPNTPLIVAVGNNDSVCGDYKIAPHEKMLKEISADFTLGDFSTGGYYAVSHPKI